ncbi:uncharacterized protein [Aegilops tauschii subsp. strangulata]|uniref:uncharacterized protein n=1 Tax=Aegilops tauschii subsp. strangulata TaxID=200361 RepID=UPI003CC8BE5A
MVLVPHGGGTGGSVSMAMPMLSLDGYTMWEAVASGDSPVNKKKCKTARALILSGLPEDVLLSVAMKPTGREVWDSLKVRFVGAERVRAARRATLHGELDRLKMEDGETLDVYAGRLAGIAAQFAGLGETLGDTELVKKLLDTFCVLEELTYDEALGRLRAFDERVQRRGQDNGERAEDQLLYTAAQWRVRERRQGGARDDDDDVRSVATRDVGNRRGRCYKCGERDHFKRDCPQLRNWQVTEQALLANADVEDDGLL